MEDGRQLRMLLTWTEPFYEIDVMHRKRLTDDAPDKIEKHHPKYVRFERALRLLRMRSFYSIEAKIIILLDLSLQRHIFSTPFVGWKDSNERVLYVERKAPDVGYRSRKEKDEVELFWILLAWLNSLA